ncbi:MAG: tetratricopeptide repeat protein [Pseudomonadota bacterium]
MRNEYYDDHEQGEAVKQWLKTNGLSIFFGIALGIGGLYGWRFWQANELAGREQAANAYQQLLTDLEGDVEATREVLDQFTSTNDNAAYATLAAFSLAGKAVEERNFTEAVALLEFAEQSGAPEALKPVAGLRKARVLVQTGQLPEALAAVNRHDRDEHRGLAAEIRGDILLAQGDENGAREAYQTALDNLAGRDRSMLQMKLDDLAAPEAAADAAEAVEDAT